MIVNACAVVLSRSNAGEADRLCELYTEDLGRLRARFVGVNKPGRKLKALSEPMTRGEYRLYLNPRTGAAKAVGGQLISTHPALRGDLGRTAAGLLCCELLSGLTPERSPNRAKYELISTALETLEEGPCPWLPLAFGLRLLELCGYGLAEAAPAADGGLWEALHQAPWAALKTLAWVPEAGARLGGLVFGHAEAQTGRGLKSLPFLEALKC